MASCAPPQLAVDLRELADLLQLADAVLEELKEREVEFPAAAGLRGAVAQMRVSAQVLA